MTHKRIEFEHNGERRREESAWTWVCTCGATESASTKKEANREWQYHKKQVAAEAKILAALAPVSLREYRR